ncbi:hypothetical protein ACLB1R_11240 [Escherichia coli]
MSLLLFIVSSICARQRTIFTGWWSGCFIQGIAGAGSQVLSRSIARDDCQGGNVDPHFFALLMTVNGLAPVLSPVLGGGIC